MAVPGQNQEPVTRQIIVPNDAAGQRLDSFLGRSAELELSRSRVQTLIRQGLVRVDGRPAGHNQILSGGEQVIVEIPPPEPMAVEPENIPLQIIYEDDFLLVIDKAAGMVTHPAAGNFSGTLVNALMHYSRSLSQVGGFDRPGIVHRLDKNTSGLILVAKNDQVHIKLQKQLQKREIKRTYAALICGHMKDEQGTIDLPIGRSLKDRKKMTVTRLKARLAQTDYTVVERFRQYDLLDVGLQTGRTHQIRVHFSHLGHPVFGDPDYGGRLKWHRGVMALAKKTSLAALEIMPRQALHARKLVFEHPVTGEKKSLEAPLPDDFRKLLEFLRAEEGGSHGD